MNTTIKPIFGTDAAQFQYERRRMSDWINRAARHISDNRNMSYEKRQAVFRVIEDSIRNHTPATLHADLLSEFYVEIGRLEVAFQLSEWDAKK